MEYHIPGGCSHPKVITMQGQTANGELNNPRPGSLPIMLSAESLNLPE